MEWSSDDDDVNKDADEMLRPFPVRSFVFDGGRVLWRSAV